MGPATSPAALAMELVVDLLAFVTWPVRVRDVKSAPLLSVFLPFDCAVETVCPDNAWASPFGSPWSKRMSTGGNVGSSQGLSYELEDSGYLLARHVELLDDLVNAEVLEVLNDRGHGQAGAFEHPRATDLAGDALHSGALGPIGRCHG
jgi:hypothetical protein